MFNVDSVVAVVGFSAFLAWLPWPYMLLPVLASLVFPLYPVESSQTAYVVCLMVGTVMELAFALLGRGKE